MCDFDWMDPKVMDASKIKKYAIGGSGFIFAVTLVVFAMAVAQRDSRTKDLSSDPLQANYSNQAAEGIPHDPTANAEFPPPPVVRLNDSSPDSLPSLPSTAALTDTAESVVNPLRNAGNDIAAQISDSLQDAASQIGEAAEQFDATSMPEPPPLGSVSDLPSITSADLQSDLSNNVPAALPPLGSLPPTLGGTPGAAPELPNSTAFPSGSLPPLLSNSTSDEDILGNNDSSLPPANDRFGAEDLNSTAPGLPNTTIPTPNSQSNLGNFPPEMSPSPFKSQSPAVAPTLPSTGGSGNVAPVTPLPTTDGFSSSAPSFPNAAPQAIPSLMESAGTPNAIANSSPNNRSTIQQAPTLQQAPAAQQAPAPINGGLPDVTGRNALNAAMVSAGAGAAGGAGAAALLSSAAPGIRQLEGSQNPSLEILKRAPNEVQVGVPATFTLTVRNVGTASAFDVAVHDSVPKGAKLVRTTPTAQVDAEGKILWKLGEIPAGSEQVLTLDLTPESEGELGSVASVTFAAQASVRTVSTQPKLTVKQTVSSTVLGGEVASIVIEVINTGTGTARDVELEEDVPANMRHASGVSTLGLTIGDLAPGESEKVVIELTGVSAGQAINRVRAIASNNAAHESEATINVVLPKLVVTMDGPRLRYLERQATYRAAITNSGTAIAHDVELLLYLPRGMEFTSAANEGTYLREQHAVVWSLAELAAGATVNTEVTLLPVQEGEFVLRMQCDAVGVQAEAIDKKVQVEGQSELAFTIEDDNDPIETDGLTTYIVKITNSGTRIDSNVQLVFEIPEGSVSEQVHAPVNHQPAQRAIVFDPIPKMQPKDTQTYRIAVRHSREGTIVARAQLKSDNRPVPVIKEESTHVYRDN